jgi:hypothetical protein
MLIYLSLVLVVESINLELVKKNQSLNSIT